jgi:hypothetical protein
MSKKSKIENSMKGDEHRIEELNEIRRAYSESRAAHKVARGSARSKKAISYTKPRRPRHQSAKQFERQVSATKAAASAVGHTKSAASLKDSCAFLKEKFQLDVKKCSTPAALWNELLERDHRISVRKADAQYLKALTFVYAVYEVVANSNLTEQHLSMIYEKAGVKPSCRTDILQLIARLLIDYDDGTTAQRKRSRGAVSRDVKAIRWLISQGIHPRDVLTYHAEHGGGVDKWSRLASKNVGIPKSLIGVNCNNVSKQQSRADRDAAYFDDVNETENEAPLTATLGGRFTTDAKPTKKTCFVECISGGRKLHDGDGLLVIVKKKEMAPIGLQIIATGKLGVLRAGDKERGKNLAAVFGLAKRLLGAKRKR